ncbi:MAG TPA: 50S ribosomal protein L19 [Candidatus Paceibacterota bacterium]|nr:50S ribosomal protein L19 [Candidatus Paceibacterota bacterium]
MEEATTAPQEAFSFTPVDVEARKKLDFNSGDSVRVWSKIEDKGKYRLQAFEGIVLARKHGTSPTATFTVRKVSNGVGVERVFPLFSPMIDKIEITKKTKTRRSKLYYIREKAVKEIRRKMKQILLGKESVEVQEEATEESPKE